MSLKQGHWPGGPRAPHPAALTAAEQAALLAVLDSERFADKSPAQVWAILLDEGLYLASVRTMYRVLTLADQVRERRAQAQGLACARPDHAICLSKMEASAPFAAFARQRPARVASSRICATKASTLANFSSPRSQPTNSTVSGRP